MEHDLFQGTPANLIGRRRDATRYSMSTTLSIAIPVYNEESVLPELYERLMGVLRSLPDYAHEVVFVDDGSTDGTAEWLQALADITPCIRVVTLSRNFGHQAALTAALDHVTGDIIVVMDGDLQDTPETIPRFLNEYKKGFEVVYAVRQDRKEPWWLRLGYAAFYRVIGNLAAIELPQGAGDFALLSRRVVQQMQRTGERHRYLRGLRTWVGFRQTGVPVSRDARHSGTSKYTLSKLLKLAFDGIFAFSAVPLRAATWLGSLTIAGSLLFAGYSLFAKFFLDSPIGFTALILAITFLAGVQLLFLGVIGEYVGRVYDEVKRRPHYVIDRVVAADSTPEVDAPTGITSPSSSMTAESC